MFSAIIKIHHTMQILLLVHGLRNRMIQNLNEGRSVYNLNIVKALITSCFTMLKQNSTFKNSIDTQLKVCKARYKVMF